MGRLLTAPEVKRRSAGRNSHARLEKDDDGVREKLAEVALLGVRGLTARKPIGGPICSP